VEDNPYSSAEDQCGNGHTGGREDQYYPFFASSLSGVGRNVLLLITAEN
jgi:hypothetical protein